MENIYINNIDEIRSSASKFIEAIGNHKLIAFYGEMGVGKTSLIKELCSLLNVPDVVNSPSFAIVNEYETTDEEFIYHFDCYRLKSYEEALNIGIEEYFYSDSYCFIEWPERIEDILPENCLKVKISKDENGTRTISF
jgi:tRNA threonylcarbamoyladenosine biosynthesis protein TsaE